MTHTIPTNKLRDLIAVLQKLDPDIEHSLETITVVAPHRRLIKFGETTEAEVITEITDQINPCCNATTVDDLVRFINKLDEDNDALRTTAKEIRESLGELSVKIE